MVMEVRHRWNINIFSISHIIVTLLVTVTLSTSYGQQTDIIERTQELSDRVNVDWIFNFTAKSVEFWVTAETHGFVGFGLSPQGGMNNADVIIGGVTDSGEVYFTDWFARGKEEPKIDEHQDWLLMDAFENATHTVLHFNRALDTCDDDDLPITNDTTKFIWSLGSTDTIAYHEARGSSSVILLDPPTPLVDTSIFDSWNVVVNTTIPTKDTVYWCTVHKTPQYSSKRHIVGVTKKMEGGLK